ncbi:hypothetical protein QFC20_006300 [Naganishia adeliensis]|uniref:Uncharacterized protein n=1 Tax=Naganishia adeliensis TaxID=92952 RepID=A0ACC2VCF8_9TREE|nr:hypothetical protein QFC20_006300 [Naganishia adeliensis]
MSRDDEQNRQLPSFSQGFTTPSPDASGSVSQGLRLPFNMHNYSSTHGTARMPWPMAPLQPSQLINRPTNAVFSYHDADKRPQVSSSMPNIYDSWPQPQPSGQRIVNEQQQWVLPQHKLPVARSATPDIARQPIGTPAMKLPVNSSRYEMDFGVKDISAKDFILKWLGRRNKMIRWLGKKQGEKMELMEELRKELAAGQYKDRKASSLFEQVDKWIKAAFEGFDRRRATGEGKNVGELGNTLEDTIMADIPEYAALRDVIMEIDPHRADPLDLQHSNGSTGDDAMAATAALLSRRPESARSHDGAETSGTSSGAQRAPVYSTPLANPVVPPPASARDISSRRAIELARKDKNRRGNLGDLSSGEEDDDADAESKSANSGNKRKRGPAKRKAAAESVAEMVEGSHNSLIASLNSLQKSASEVANQRLELERQREKRLEEEKVKREVKEQEERQAALEIRKLELSSRSRELAIREEQAQAEAALAKAEAKRKERQAESEAREYFLELCRKMNRESAGRIAFGRGEWEAVKEDMLEFARAMLDDA